MTDDGTPGIDYSYFEVDGTLDLGGGTGLLLAFAPGISPDTANAFWRAPRTWVIARSPNRIASEQFGGLYTPGYTSGQVFWSTMTAMDGSHELVLAYQPFSAGD